MREHVGHGEQLDIGHSRSWRRWPDDCAGERAAEKEGTVDHQSSCSTFRNSLYLGYGGSSSMLGEVEEMSMPPIAMPCACYSRGSWPTSRWRGQDLVNQLSGFGEKNPDEEITDHMLTALPEFYEPLVSSVGYRSETPTLRLQSCCLIQRYAMKWETQSEKVNTLIETISIPANQLLQWRKRAPVTFAEARIIKWEIVGI
jgi:hypothetical protein